MRRCPFANPACVRNRIIVEVQSAEESERVIQNWKTERLIPLYSLVTFAAFPGLMTSRNYFPAAVLCTAIVATLFCFIAGQYGQTIVDSLPVCCRLPFEQIFRHQWNGSACGVRRKHKAINQRPSSRSPQFRLQRLINRSEVSVLPNAVQMSERPQEHLTIRNCRR